MMELEEWAVEQAAHVVSEVERHGVEISWSEAHEQLLVGARFLHVPAYVDQGDGDLVPLPRADEAPVSVCPGFAEEVACSIVHYEGKPFFPLNPATSQTRIAVPWDIASELVTRLNFVLWVRLCAADSMQEVQEMVELASLATSLSYRIADELGWVGDDDIVDDEKIEGRRCLLVPASEAMRAAQLLNVADMLMADDASTSALDQRVVDHLVDAEAHDTFLWGLEWWIADRTHNR